MKLADLFRPKKNTLLGAVVDLGAAVKERFSPIQADTSLHSADHEEGGQSEVTEYEEEHRTTEQYAARIETPQATTTVRAEKTEVFARSYRSLNIPLSEAERLANQIRLQTLHSAEEWYSESRDRAKFRPIADALFGASTRKKVERNAELRKFTGYDQDGRPLKKPASPLHFDEFRSWAQNAGLQYTVVRTKEIWVVEYQFFFGAVGKDPDLAAGEAEVDAYLANYPIPDFMKPANEGTLNKNLSPTKEAGGGKKGKGEKGEKGKGEKGKPGKGDKKAQKASKKKSGGLSPGHRPEKTPAPKMLTLSKAPTLGELSQKLGVAKYELLFGKGKIADSLDVTKILADVRERELCRVREGRWYLERRNALEKEFSEVSTRLRDLEEQLPTLEKKLDYALKKGKSDEAQANLDKLRSEIESLRRTVKLVEEELNYCPKWLQNFNRRIVSRADFEISAELATKVSRIYGFEVNTDSVHVGVGTYVRGYFYGEHYPRIETRIRETKVQVYSKTRLFGKAPIPEETRSYAKNLRKEAEKSGDLSAADQMDNYISTLRNPYQDYSWDGGKYKHGVISINWIFSRYFSNVEVEEKRGDQTVKRALQGSEHLEAEKKDILLRTVRVLDVVTR